MNICLMRCVVGVYNQSEHDDFDVVDSSEIVASDAMVELFWLAVVNILDSNILQMVVQIICSTNRNFEEIWRVLN